MDQEPTFAASRKVTREKALTAFRVLIPDGDEELVDAKSYRTWAQYLSAWRVYLRWCKERGYDPMALSPGQLKEFVRWLHAEGKTAATIRSYVAALVTILRNHGVRVDRLGIIDLLKAYAKTDGPARQARGLIGRDLQALVARLDADLARNCRDASLLLLGYAIAGRSAELVGLDLARSGGRFLGGTGVLSAEHRGYVVELLTSKAKQRSRVHIAIPFAEMPSLRMWLDRWITHAAIKPGEPIFRAIHKSGRIQPSRLASDAVRRIVKARMLDYTRATGMADAEALLRSWEYSGHSMRRGYCSTASEAKLSLGEIRVRSRHGSDAMLARYIRDAEAWDSSGLGEGVGF